MIKLNFRLTPLNWIYCVAVMTTCSTRGPRFKSQAETFLIRSNIYFLKLVQLVCGWRRDHNAVNNAYMHACSMECVKWFACPCSIHTKFTIASERLLLWWLRSHYSLPLWENELSRSENTCSAAAEEEGCTNKTNLHPSSQVYCSTKIMLIWSPIMVFPIMVVVKEPPIIPKQFVKPWWQTV